MNAMATKRTTTGGAGRWVALIFLAWLAFVFVPWPRKKPEKAPTVPRLPPSELVALGLPDNPDFTGLPEFFAIWADQAEWKNDRTKFAYWNPGSNDFTYFLEATKVAGGFHFRVISEPRKEESDLGEALAKDCPIRFYYSFSVVALKLEPTVISDPGPLERPKVKLDNSAPRISPPPRSSPSSTPEPRP